jgi:hypothetical protein
MRIRFRPAILLSALGIGLITVRSIFPERGINDVGLAAIIDSFFTAGLFLFVIISANGVGLRIFRLMELENGFTSLELVVFRTALGLGVMALGSFLLGFLGLLEGIIMAIWLSLCASSWAGLSMDITLPKLPKNPSKIGILLAATIILVLSLPHALAPPWDYDGLMYHLEGPRRFLAAGRILFVPEIWQANGPFLTEMLFMTGMSLGSDAFAKLLHLSYGLLFILATFTFAERHIGRNQAWLAAAILLGIPILPIWATWAYADFAWALYEFLALYIITNWDSQKEHGRLLFLAGFFSGMALGTKYLALAGTNLLALWIIWSSRNLPVRSIGKNLVSYYGTALLIGSPWYVKNLILTGNPIFPFLFPSRDWNAARISYLVDYLQSFGYGRNALDYFLLPYNLYINHWRFGTYSLEMPSLLFPLALIYLFIRKNKILNGIGIFALFYIAIWTLGSQQTRFLLPVFPVLAVLAMVVIDSFPGEKFRRLMVGGLVGGLILVTIIYQVTYIAEKTPLKVVLGLETKSNFLSRNVYNFRATAFIAKNLPASSKVLMLWDGGAYYCGDICIPDTDQTTWLRITETYPDATIISSTLRNNGITHILFSEGNSRWFESFHDPQKKIKKSTMFLMTEFIPLCTRELYKDEVSSIYEITCP